ncbi:glycosyltransferase [Pseudomonas alvandae]|uniref:glycosyltransferase n=1 Tax=Pseudomonas canavaninivorans TaxID=2842348 RepID=UPI00215FB04E|nr:glycosyltransferase [Pseudomonas canavaninivorans]UVM71661.1 glycosyltransferase [Pseudomonas canavaninivorans]
MEYLKNDPAVKRPELLIVSSYHRACGVAQYVEFLEIPLRQQDDFDIKIAPLPVDLLRSQSSYAKRAARAEFNAILQKVERADITNIQFEPGLLGFTPRQIWRNLNAIINKSKKVIITYHTVPPLDSPRLHFSRRGAIDYLRAWRGNYVFNRLLSKIRKAPEKFHHIVQTAREAKNFALLGVRTSTITHQPLAFISRGVREQMDHHDAKLKVSEQMNINSSATLIGCFGFLSPYKGIEIAIRALSALSDEHHLLVVGGLHPEGIDKGSVKAPYIQKLLKVIEKQGLSKRVHFCGALDNEEFNRVMLACNAVVLPYAEVGQTSSGPAALALDMGRPLYCSRTKCFGELNRYQPDAVSFFEIGNYMELAEKLLLADGETPNRINARKSYLEKYSVEHRSVSYLAAAKQLIMEN